MGKIAVNGKYFISSPETDPLPIVLDSPHSGLEFPTGFAPAAPFSAIVTSCDRFVDELWSGGPAFSATLLAALFPRAFVDPNRAETDLDPEIVDGAWAGTIHTTDYTRRGMGVIRRLALPGVPMYDRRLQPTEIRRRFQDYYRPYRAALSDTLDAAWYRHGAVWHLNCHSMKSRGNEMNNDSGEVRPDFVISDRRGGTADPAFTAWAATALSDLGYRVKTNDPYQGGDLVGTFGRPAERRHSVQIEINRALYLDESSYDKRESFAPLQKNLERFMSALRSYVQQSLRSSRG